MVAEMFSFSIIFCKSSRKGPSPYKSKWHGNPCTACRARCGPFDFINEPKYAILRIPFSFFLEKLKASTLIAFGMTVLENPCCCRRFCTYVLMAMMLQY